MDSPCIKQTVCKVFKIFQCGKYLVAYVLKYRPDSGQPKHLAFIFFGIYLILRSGFLNLVQPLKAYSIFKNPENKMNLMK